MSLSTDSTIYIYIPILFFWTLFKTPLKPPPPSFWTFGRLFFDELGFLLYFILYFMHFKHVIHHVFFSRTYPWFYFIWSYPPLLPGWEKMPTLSQFFFHGFILAVQNIVVALLLLQFAPFFCGKLFSICQSTYQMI